MSTRRMWRACAPVWLLVAAMGAARAQDVRATHLVVIAGVSGEARIGAEWHGMAMALATAATQRFGMDSSRVVVLEADSTREAGRIGGRSTKATIERTLGSLARSLQATDALVVVLFAHGSSLGSTARVNLPGPDMTPEDFARVLAPATAPHVTFVHTGSASADFAGALAGPRRIVVTATKSAREQNETWFPGPFVRALTTDAGDTDKDGRVALLEAYTYATSEVAQLFTRGNLLPTEHAVMADGADGARARAFVFAPATAGSAVASSAALDARAAVQARLDALRARRASMSEDEYLQALEPLIVELIERTRALKAAPGGRP